MLFKKYEDDFQRIGEVDTEIIYQLINFYNEKQITFGGLKKALIDTNLKCYAALAFMHKNQPNLVHIVKQERPMVFAYWKEAGVIIFNSQEDLIRNVFDQMRRMSRVLYYDCAFEVKYETLKNDLYYTIDSDKTSIDEMVSKGKAISIQKPFTYNTKNYNTTSTYGQNRGKSTTSSSTASPALRLIEAKDSTGRVIEGELDEITGEITLHLKSHFEKNETEENPEPVIEHCVECSDPLTDFEVEASYNVNNPPKERVCNKCYHDAMQSVLGGVVE
ncbi:hypothetical protein D3C71_1302440 [compost metagenome]